MQAESVHFQSLLEWLYLTALVEIAKSLQCIMQVSDRFCFFQRCGDQCFPWHEKSVSFQDTATLNMLIIAVEVRTLLTMSTDVFPQNVEMLGFISNPLCTFPVMSEPVVNDIYCWLTDLSVDLSKTFSTNISGKHQQIIRLVWLNRSINCTAGAFSIEQPVCWHINIHTF